MRKTFFLNRRINFNILLLLLLTLVQCSSEKDNVYYSSLNQLSKGHFGVYSGTAVDLMILNQFPHAKISYFNSYSDAWTALRGGLIDAFAADEPSMKILLLEQPGLSILPQKISTVDYGIAINKNNTTLLHSADSVLAVISKDGRFEVLKNKWLNPDSLPSDMPTYNTDPEAEVLYLGTCTDDVPFTYVGNNNQIIGLEIELCYIIANELGMRVEVSNMPFESLLLAVATNKIDMAVDCMAITEERSENVGFTDSYYTGNICAIVRDNPLDDMFDGSNLATATVGAITGTLSEAFIIDNYPDAQLQSFEDLMDEVAALKGGKLDYVITAYSNAAHVVKNNPDLKLLPKNYTHEGTALAFHKDSELTDKVNTIIDRYLQDGTMEDMIDRWINAKGDSYEMVDLPVVDDPNAHLLTVAVCAAREPMAFVQNNEIVGLDPELAHRVAYELGMRLEFSDMKFSALLPSLVSGKTNMIASNFTHTAERAKKVDFTHVYFQNPQVLITRNISHDSIISETNSYEEFFDTVHSNLVHEKRYLLILNGLKVTCIISLLSLILGTVIGGLVCYMRMSKNKLLSLIAKVYIDLLRGIPQVVLLMIMFYVVFASSSISGLAVASITFSLNFAAYVSEMFRTSIESVSKGQTEAGIAMGFNKIQTFTTIVVPQAVQKVLPVFKGEFISLVKMTSIVGYIAVQDLTKAGDIIRSRTFDAFFPLILVAVLYFLLAWLLTQLLTLIEFKTVPKRNK